jgi:hypothetical protein
MMSVPESKAAFGQVAREVAKGLMLLKNYFGTWATQA